MASVLFENGNECLSVYLFVVDVDDGVVVAVGFLVPVFRVFLGFVVVSVLSAAPKNEVNQLWQRKRRLMC